MAILPVYYTEDRKTRLCTRPTTQTQKENVGGNDRCNRLISQPRAVQCNYAHEWCYSGAMLRQCSSSLEYVRPNGRSFEPCHTDSHSTLAGRGRQLRFGEFLLGSCITSDSLLNQRVTFADLPISNGWVSALMPFSRKRQAPRQTRIMMCALHAHTHNTKHKLRFYSQIAVQAQG